MKNKLILAAIAAPLIFGGMHTSALAACTGGAGSTISCAKIGDFKTQSNDWADAELASTTLHFQTLFAAAIGANPSINYISAGLQDLQQWGHYSDGTTHVSYGRDYAYKSAYVSDGVNAEYIASESKDDYPNVGFNIGNVQSTNIAAGGSQSAYRNFYASVYDLVATVANGVTTYTATFDWSFSFSGSACTTVACTRYSSTNGGDSDTFQITLATVPTAVPGPEAGAGLGALTLGGMALYMKRRRKGEATAA